MTVTDIADEIYLENGEPTDTSVAAIAYWVRNTIGLLNTRIFTSYSLDSSFDIIDANGNSIDIEAVSILKKIWIIHRYDALIRNNLTSLDSSSIISITDDGSSIRKVDRTQIVRTLRDLKKDDVEELSFLIASYKIRESSPSSIDGDDTEGVYR